MSAPDPPVVYTVGHSNHEWEDFLRLLTAHGITVVADVRSAPYSRHWPWFSQEPLLSALERAGIRYLFLGREFGARRAEQECYRGNRVDFDLVREAPLFQEGIERLRRGAAELRVALLCAEKDPIDCHRTVLVARSLALAGFEVRHILEDGELESMEEVTTRIMAATKVPEETLFQPREELEAEAYRRRGEKVAWADAEEKTADSEDRP